MNVVKIEELHNAFIAYLMRNIFFSVNFFLFFCLFEIHIAFSVHNSARYVFDLVYLYVYSVSFFILYVCRRIYLLWLYEFLLYIYSEQIRML